MSLPCLLADRNRCKFSTYPEPAIIKSYAQTAIFVASLSSTPKNRSTRYTRFGLEALGLLEALRRSVKHPTHLGPVVARAQQRPKHDIARMDLFREGEPKGREL